MMFSPRRRRGEKRGGPKKKVTEETEKKSRGQTTLKKVGNIKNQGRKEKEIPLENS